MPGAGFRVPSSWFRLSGSVFAGQRTILALVLGVAVAAVLLALLVHVLEPRLAFFPEAGESTTPRDFGIGYEELTAHTGDGEQLRGWSLAAPAARARILYFHGNGGNLSVWTPILAGIVRQGYALSVFDYRGY